MHPRSNMHFRFYVRYLEIRKSVSCYVRIFFENDVQMLTDSPMFY
jgi:hypothetical protein